MIILMEDQYTSNRPYSDYSSLHKTFNSITLTAYFTH